VIIHSALFADQKRLALSSTALASKASQYLYIFVTNGRDCAYFIEKEGIIQNRLAGQNKSDYSRAKSVVKPFTLAAIQMDNSLLIFAEMVATENSWWLKTRSFRSFQISQGTRSARLLEALKGMSGVAVMLAHHSKGVALYIHSVGLRLGCPVQNATCVQIRRV
jgi:hypothetical protein